MDGLQVASPSNNEPQAVVANGPEISPDKLPTEEASQRKVTRIWGVPKTLFVVIAASTILLIVAGIVVGGVVGSRKKSLQPR